MASIRSTDGIYQVIEEALASSEYPQTCAELMKRPAVRAAAVERFGSDLQIATNKVSDTLAFMWRRDVINRFTAPPSQSMARYAYASKEKNVAVTKECKPIAAPVKSDLPKLDKHALSITERDGEVVLDFKQFTIVIRPK